MASWKPCRPCAVPPSPTWRKKAGWPWKRSLTNPSSGISFRSSRPSARKASLNTRSTSWSTNFSHHSKTTNEPQSWDRSKNAVKQKSTSISAASACVRTVTRSVCVTSPKVCALRCSNWQSIRFPENPGVLRFMEGRRFLSTEQ